MENRKKVAGDAWSDFLPGSKDLISDWTKPINCGTYNTVTKNVQEQTKKKNMRELFLSYFLKEISNEYYKNNTP